MGTHAAVRQGDWMPALKIQFTPVVAPTGKVVHAMTLTAPNTTACGMKFRGWRIALRALDCMDCKRALHLACKKA